MRALLFLIRLLISQVPPRRPTFPLFFLAGRMFSSFPCQVQSPTSADFLRVTESDFLTDVLL